MMCPQCGGIMAPTDATCKGCGFSVAGGSAATSTAVADPQSDADQVAPDPEVAAAEGPRYRAPDGGGSQIKIRKDKAPMRPDRAADGHRHSPEDVPSAAGGVGEAPPTVGVRKPEPAPQPSSGISVARPEPEAVRPPSKPSTTAPRPRGPVALARSSPWATAALISAFPAVFVWPLGLVSLVLGIVGLRHVAKGDGLVTGKGRALFGVVVGSLTTLVLVAGLAWFTVGGGAQLLGQVYDKFMLATHMGILQEIANTQEHYRAGKFSDADGDGLGEYGEATDLVQARSDMDLTELQNGALGWRLIVELPRSTNSREQRWWAFMEPQGADATDRPWLYIDESGVLRMAEGVQGTPSRRHAKQWPATAPDLVFAAKTQ